MTNRAALPSRPASAAAFRTPGNLPLSVLARFWIKRANPARLLFFADKCGSFDLSPAHHRTDAAFGARNEIPEKGNLHGPGTLRRFLLCLPCIQSAPIKEIERFLHLIPQRRTVACPAQADYVDCRDAIPAHRNRKRRNIFVTQRENL